MPKQVKVSAISTCYKNGYKFFPELFACAASQTIKDQLEVVLVHYNPSDEEREMVRKFQAENPDLLTYIEGPQENVACAMNRAAKAAKGEYLAIWNIDDLRTPNSFELEAKVLDENPDIAYTYGDIIMVSEWMKKTGRAVTYPEFEKREFIRSMPLGCFYMWRRTVNDRIGYFDEQFNSATDFDFSARMTTEFDGKKCQGLLGYYLDIGGGISTGKGALAKNERTLVELRYGSYRKVDFLFIRGALKYRVNEVLEGNTWTPIDQLAPHRKDFMDSKIWWLYAVIRYPFWIIRRAINHYTRRFYQKYR